LKEEYESAFILAKDAGFDGIELHGAFGYLIDEFLRSFTNRRTDEYGGSAENRTRFPLEVIDIALKHFEPHQVGIKISPTSRIQDMFDESPLETYGYFLKELSKRNIGFVELAESAHENSYGARVLHIPPKAQIEEVCKAFRPYFNGLIIGNYGFTSETGIKAIREGHCDAVSFGKSYIAHPDLAERIIKGVELNNKLDFTTLYYNKEKGRAAGYTDYPFHLTK
jgi:N-ethylmaleimide reductase